MTDVSCVRSLSERLAHIAADCFDLRAAQRLRELVEELHDPSRKIGTERTAVTDGEGAAPV